MIHYKIAKILVIIGGLNWGLVGVTNLMNNHFDLVEYIGYILLNLPVITDLIYLIVGIAALVMVIGMVSSKTPSSASSN